MKLGGESAEDDRGGSKARQTRGNRGCDLRPPAAAGAPAAGGSCSGWAGGTPHGRLAAT